jgi:hypothetical protein
MDKIRNDHRRLSHIILLPYSPSIIFITIAEKVTLRKESHRPYRLMICRSPKEEEDPILNGSGINQEDQEANRRLHEIDSSPNEHVNYRRLDFTAITINFSAQKLSHTIRQSSSIHWRRELFSGLASALRGIPR